MLKKKKDYPDFCMENGDMEAREEAGGWVRKQLHLYKWR